MKRYMALLLTLCFLLSAAGCKAQPAQPSNTATDPIQTHPTETTLAVDTEPVVLDGPMTAVSLPATTDVTLADDGTEIFTYTYQNISLTMSGQAAADHVLLDFRNRINSIHTTANSILASAEENYSDSENWVPYFCQVLYEPTRIDRGVLSLFGNVVTFSGASHPDRSCTAANYDLLSGDVLTLGSILTHIDSVDSLCRLVIEKLDALSTEKHLYSDYAKTVQQRFSGEESYDQDWYFSDEGLCFYFSPYEIAPYSSGVIIAQIPYSELVGIVADAYFPAEKPTLSGTVTVEAFDSALADQFTQIGEVVFHSEGQMYLIHADSSVSDLRVCYTDAAGESYTAFACQYLNPNDAVMVQILEADAAAISLQYSSSAEQIQIPLIAQ